jgi:CDP-glucose 4,6-dehydratase
VAFRARTLEGLGMSPQFWNGKRVFLTGHTGFKGGWLSLWLQSLGANLTGYALNPPRSPNLFQVADVSNGMLSIAGDVRDFDGLKKAIKAASPEIVIHMAAQPLVRESYKNPVETYATNVMGTVNLLESVRQSDGIKVVVNVTTDKCYKNQEWVWGYRESEPMGGYDPYSNSKGCSELVTSSYRSSFFNSETYKKHGVAIATARAGNVIGGGDWSRDRLIPDILAAFEAGTPVYIRNPGAIRPWQFVLEPLRGYLDLAERLYCDGPKFAEAWNFGPEDRDSLSVRNIAHKMADLWDGDASWEISEGFHPHEAHYLKLDISKAANQLNWRPILDIENALKLTVEWTLALKSKANMRAYTTGQIEKYQSFIAKN